MGTIQDSMAEQLCALYAEKEALEARFPDMSAADIVEVGTGVRPTEPLDHLSSLEAADSLEAQLIDLYAEKQILAAAFSGHGHRRRRRRLRAQGCGLTNPKTMSFVSSDLLDNLSGADRPKADAQDYGVVQVDDAGVILMYNRYESELAGIDPNFAEGRNFFTQVAPCTNNRLFFGRF